MIPATPQYQSPAGPAWVRDAQTTTVHTDRRGQRWIVTAVLRGGRELHWKCLADGRVATNAITQDHPDYPSDAAVVQWEREQRPAAAARAAAGPWRYWP